MVILSCTAQSNKNKNGLLNGLMLAGLGVA